MRKPSVGKSESEILRFAALALVAVGSMPLYRLAEASPTQPPQISRKLVYTAPKGAGNPFRYSVYQEGNEFWIQIEKDGKIRRFLWEDAKGDLGKNGARVEPDEEGWVRGDAKQLSFVFVRHDVRDALRALFRQTKVSFEIDPRVQGDVTVSCQNVALDTSLSNVLRQVGATYHVENGVYKVIPEGMDKP